MGSELGDKHIRVPQRAYDRIKALKRDDETMGEAVDRLIGGYTLLDFAADAAISTKEAEELRTNLDEVNEAYHESVEDLIE